jgi:hypothetical protein
VTSGRLRWQRIDGTPDRAKIEAGPAAALVALARYAQTDAT